MKILFVPYTIKVDPNLPPFLTVPFFTPPVQTENICNEQSFTPSCTRLEVLMVEQALYGRMRINECAVQNFGYMGCKRDVLPYIDSWCSGRHTCSVKVLDQSFPVQRCHADLKGYLEVQYRCLKGTCSNMMCV